jgi:flavin reductase (DIM6/NTAB) family NADH-FMN oxidoreductase RutF
MDARVQALRVAAREAFRRFIWPVTVLTYADANGVRGVTISSVTSLSLDPPSVVFCINRKSRTHEVLAIGATMSLSVLSAADAGTAERLSEGGGPKIVAPDELELDQQGATGSLALRGAAAAFDIAIVNLVPAFSHSVVIAVIERSIVPVTPTTPLGYHDGDFVSEVRRVR